MFDARFPLPPPAGFPKTPPVPALKEILDLVARFELHLDAYKSGQYNETQLRRDFLDPFFKALGWDIDNSSGHAEAYRDVIHEDAVRVGDAVKAPDYSFRIGGQRKFFLEAKKPSVHIKEDIAPAFQLRRYAWSAKLPLSVLSDFEEFAIYDCRLKPDRTDKASIGRVFYCTFREFAEKWDHIASIFSKDAVLKGSFDKFAESNKTKRGTTEVDAAFLEEIEKWRSDLASNLALRNKSLTQRELNFAVQRIIDRIIFLRICEDRGIETYKRLHALTDKAGIYGRLCERFQEADDRYNSGLFHFKAGKERHEAPDALTLGLDIDDKLLRELLRGLYYPDSPYEFSVLSADILGQVYEQFLGKVIGLTEGHRAKIEEKPEVRKAGGVFYTPTYIVAYIVRETVGKLLDDTLPTQPTPSPPSDGGEGWGEGLHLTRPSGTLSPVLNGGEGSKPLVVRDAARVLEKISKLRILDPACGSGSFLIGAYQFLLDWHLRFYLANNPGEWAREKKARKGSKGQHPALVQTRNGGWQLGIAERKRILLNNIYGVDLDSQAVEVTKLSLLLKVLEGEAVQTQMSLGLLDRVLPDLGDNIKCGNSLIGPDFYQQDELPALTDDDRYRLNVFDWPHEFAEIFRDGGFDAVIGNPPYGAFTGEAETIYFRAGFKSPANSLDTFLLFVEQGHRLLRERGFFGMIIPSGWVSAPSAKPLRKLFVESFKPLAFVTLPFDVFRAYIDTVVVAAQRVKYPAREVSDEVQLTVFPSNFKVNSIADFQQFKKSANFRDWLSSQHAEFLITCSREEARILEKVRRQPKSFGDYVLVKRGIEVFAPQSAKQGLVKPLPALTGTLQSYNLQHGEAGFVGYPPGVEASKPLPYFSKPRILLRQVLSRKLRLQAVFTEETFLTNQSVQSLIPSSAAESAPSLKVLLGVLNSRLLSWYFVNFNSVARRDDFPKIIIQQTRELPLPSFEQKPAKSLHDQIVKHVETMLELHQKLAAAQTPQEKTGLERQIAVTDSQIDRLVYQLYGLTEPEIALVEGRSPLPVTQERGEG